MHPLVTEHVPLHSKSLYQNMARASDGENNMHPSSCGGGAKLFNNWNHIIISDLLFPHFLTEEDFMLTLVWNIFRFVRYPKPICAISYKCYLRAYN